MKACRHLAPSLSLGLLKFARQQVLAVSSGCMLRAVTHETVGSDHGSYAWLHVRRYNTLPRLPYIVDIMFLSGGVGALKTTLSHDAILGIAAPVHREEGAHSAKLCKLDIDEAVPTPGVHRVILRFSDAGSIFGGSLREDMGVRGWEN